MNVSACKFSTACSHAYDDFDEYHGNHGHGGYAFEAHTDQKQHEAVVLAKQIAEMLEQGRVKQGFNNFIFGYTPGIFGSITPEH